MLTTDEIVCLYMSLVSAQLTMSNVENRSQLLWVHALMAWAVSLVVYRVRARPLPIEENSWPPVQTERQHHMPILCLCLHILLAISLVVYRVCACSLRDEENSAPSASRTTPIPVL